MEPWIIGHFSLFLVCILFSAMFSSSEAVLLSIGIDRAKQIIEEGGSRARAMLFMTEKPSELLTTILIGNTIANILAASISTDLFSRLFSSHTVGISAGVTTILVLVFGEIFPKVIGRSKAETMSVFVVRFLQTLYYLLYPIIEFAVWFIHKVLGPDAQVKGRVITKNDLEYMINKAENEKTMDPKQIELLNSIMDFPTIKVKDIMVPRTHIKYLQASWNYETMVDKVKIDIHSRYPVCDGELEHALGLVHVKDLAIVPENDRKNFNIKKYLKAPFFVYEHMKIQAVFDHMNRKKIHLALVKDENGVVVGIVTLEDIVEQIVGEIVDEHDDSIKVSAIHAKLEQGVRVDGNISLRDLYTEYDIKIPLNDTYSTLAGFILDMLGNNFPDEAQIIVWEGYSFELTSVKDQEIKEVLIKDVDGEKHLYSKKEAHELAIDPSGEIKSEGHFEDYENKIKSRT